MTTMKTFNTVNAKVVEIDVASGKCSILITIAKPDDGELMESLNCTMEDPSCFQGMGSNTTVVGCGNFVVLTSIAGKSIAGL